MSLLRLTKEIYAKGVLQVRPSCSISPVNDNVLGCDKAMSSSSPVNHHTPRPDMLDEWSAFQTARGPPPEEPDTSDPVAFAAFRKLLRERIEAKNKWMAEHPSPQWERAPRLKSLDALGSILSILSGITSQTEK